MSVHERAIEELFKTIRGISLAKLFGDPLPENENRVFYNLTDKYLKEMDKEKGREAIKEVEKIGKKKSTKKKGTKQNEIMQSLKPNDN